MLRSHGVLCGHLGHLFIDSSGMCCQTAVECSSGVLWSHGALCSHWDIYLLILLVRVVQRQWGVVVVRCVVVVCCVPVVCQ